MPTASNGFFSHPLVRRWAPFLAKAVVLLGLLFVIARTVPHMPTVGVALLWAALSALSTLGLAYHAVVRKLRRQHALKDGGYLAKINSGRIGSLIVGFILSAILVGGLLLELPTWENREWILVAFSIPVYLLVSIVVSKRVEREYEPAYQASRTALWSSAIVGVLLCIGFVALNALSPAPAYTSAAEAFQSVPQPFADSPSAIMAEAGKLTALVDGFTAYGLSRVGEVSFAGYLAWRCALYASAFFGIVNLLGLCSLDWAELKKVFQPLHSSSASESTLRLVKRYIAAAAILPVCLVVAVFACNQAVVDSVDNEGRTAAERFIHSQIDVAVYLIDGTYYEQQGVDDLIASTQKKSDNLSETARATLVPLINESFDARVANVDSYLDWYYSLPADYERLANLVTGNIEAYAAEQFGARIEEGIDDTRLTEAIESFSNQAAQLQADFEAELAKHKVEGTPEWLLTVKSISSIDFLSEPLEPSHKLLEAPQRLGISAAAGVGAGIIAKRLAKKAATKPFFKMVVSKITGTIASKTTGAAIGGAAGSIGGPAGTVLGIVAGAGISIGVDYALLMADEYMNRESYKSEIVETIEAERAEMLALVDTAG